MGLVCAVLSMLLPPRLACVELKMRLAFQALSVRQAPRAEVACRYMRGPRNNLKHVGITYI